MKSKEEQKKCSHQRYLKNREKRLEQTKKWQKEHPEKVKEIGSNWDKKNREKRKKQQKERRNNFPEKCKEIANRFYFNNIEKCRNWSDSYKKENPEKIREYSHKFYENHPEVFFMSNSLHRMLRLSILSKNSKTYQYIGCSPGFLRNHLESLFKSGMTWENYGDWEIDHIIPVSWFPFDKDPDLLFVASHWSNLQPMWKIENREKNNRFVGKTFTNKV